MSETNRVGLYFVNEASEGKLPANPDFTQLEYTGSPGLGGEISSIVSETIRADRQIPDLIVTGQTISGTINVELATSANDDLLAASFFNSWSRKGNFLASDISSVDGSGSVLTFANDEHGLLVGDVCLVAGVESDASQNGLHKVTAVSSADVTLASLTLAQSDNAFSLRKIGYSTATQPVLDKTLKTITITDLDQTFRNGEWIGLNVSDDDDKGFYRIVSSEAGTGTQVLTYDQSFPYSDFQAGISGEALILYGDYLINGTEKRTLSLLQRFESHSPTTVYRYSGISISSLDLSFEAQAIVTAAFEVNGLDTIQDSTSYTLTPAVVAGRLSTGTDVIATLLNGSAVAQPNIVQTASLNINNNLRQQTGVGFIGTVSNAAGQCNVSGSLSVYFGSPDVYQQLVDNIDTSLLLGFKDSEDNRILLFDVPRVKFSSGAPDVPSGNADIILAMDFQGILDKTKNYQILCQTFFYV